MRGAQKTLQVRVRYLPSFYVNAKSNSIGCRTDTNTQYMRTHCFHIIDTESGQLHGRIPITTSNVDRTYVTHKGLVVCLVFDHESHNKKSWKLGFRTAISPIPGRSDSDSDSGPVLLGVYNPKWTTMRIFWQSWSLLVFLPASPVADLFKVKLILNRQFTH